MNSEEAIFEKPEAKPGEEMPAAKITTSGDALILHLLEPEEETGASEIYVPANALTTWYALPDGGSEVIIGFGFNAHQVRESPSLIAAGRQTAINWIETCELRAQISFAQAQAGRIAIAGRG